MSKLVQGSIAGAAGIALLLGGAGTFALWNATAAVSAQTITAGTLSLTANADGVWKNDGTPIPASAYRIIPGTTLVFTQTLTVSAVGDGLTADLAHTGLPSTNSLAAVTIETLEVTSPTATVSGSTLTFTSGTSIVDVKLTVVFPEEATTGKDAVLDLNALNFTLTQTVT
jgi:alternate signal-mediated exported protein